MEGQIVLPRAVPFPVPLVRPSSFGHRAYRVKEGPLVDRCPQSAGGLQSALASRGTPIDGVEQDEDHNHSPSVPECEPLG